jgi:hypothetical protein
MILAIISDFNGAIADDETPNLRCIQQKLAEHGQSNLEGVGPESIETLILSNRPAEPSGQVPRR